MFSILRDKAMRRGILILIGLVIVGLAPTDSFSNPEIPSGAIPLTNEEIKVALGGKSFNFVVYDAAKSLTGSSTWDLERGAVSGKYVYDNQSPKKWKRTWYVENNKNCTKPRNAQPECQNIYLDGEIFIEVTDDGTIHAVSTLVK
jgi:hypothetical protein